MLFSRSGAKGPSVVQVVAQNSAVCSVPFPAAVAFLCLSVQLDMHFTTDLSQIPSLFITHHFTLKFSLFKFIFISLFNFFIFFRRMVTVTRRKSFACSSIDIDNVIGRLTNPAAQANAQWRHGIDVSESEVRALCLLSRELLLSQPMLLELSAPLKIVGDIHGQFPDLLRLFHACGFPPKSNYLFLGDYVDRGPRSLETIVLLLCYKLKYPLNFFLLRGNHEVASLNRIYGFYNECKSRMNIRVWKAFQDVFNCLPVAALINSKIFCCHGGLSPHLRTLEQLKRIQRPAEVQESGLLCDILWSDPDPKATGWAPNDRGVSYVFGVDVLQQFLTRMDLDIVVRGHQVVEDGYEFFGRRGLVTVFSAPNYCGEFDNAGAVMNVDRSLLCSFQILKPSYSPLRERKINVTVVGSDNGTNAKLSTDRPKRVRSNSPFRRA